EPGVARCIPARRQAHRKSGGVGMRGPTGVRCLWARGTGLREERVFLGFVFILRQHTALVCGIQGGQFLLRFRRQNGGLLHLTGDRTWMRGNCGSEEQATKESATERNRGRYFHGGWELLRTRATRVPERMGTNITEVSSGAWRR